MRPMNYKFNYKPEIYEHIMRNIYLSKEKQEDVILDLLRQGKTCQQIGEQVNYSERTIQRKRKELNNRIQDLFLS